MPAPGAGDWSGLSSGSVTNVASGQVVRLPGTFPYSVGQ